MFQSLDSPCQLQAYKHPGSGLIKIVRKFTCKNLKLNSVNYSPSRKPDYMHAYPRYSYLMLVSSDLSITVYNSKLSVYLPPYFDMVEINTVSQSCCSEYWAVDKVVTPINLTCHCENYLKTSKFCSGESHSTKLKVTVAFCNA